MRTPSPHGCKEYIITAGKISSQLLDNLSKNPQVSEENYNSIVYYTYNTLGMIQAHPGGDLYGKWQDVNFRYGYERSCVGMTSELIAVTNLSYHYGNLTMATIKTDQVQNTVDLLSDTSSFQVKTVCFVGNTTNLYNINNLNLIKSDYICLVDIGDRDHWTIEINKLQSYKNQKITKQELKSISTYYFDNINLYNV
ncbi:MAG: hypothetical protein ACXW2E_01515 [Nitrososphaeraceae archaeon]